MKKQLTTGIIAWIDTVDMYMNCDGHWCVLIHVLLCMLCNLSEGLFHYNEDGWIQFVLVQLKPVLIDERESYENIRH